MAKVCIFLIMAALIVGMAGCDDTTQNLKIRDWYDLDAVRDNLGGDHTLMNDLDSTTEGYEELASPTANGGEGWQPIGAWNNGFTGSLDGRGYEVRDLFIARPDDRWVGLFSVVDDMGVVRNVGVVNADVSGRQFVGALAGENKGSVLNCYSTGSVSGVEFVGGLAGRNYGVRESVPSATFIGDFFSVIDDSYSAASVSGEFRIGGLVGHNIDTLSRSYSTGDVTGHSSVGGLVGANGGPVRDCYYVGNVTGDVSVGGLVGENVGFYSFVGTVSNSYYNYDEVLINGENVITIGALFAEDFDEWLATDKFLDVNERLSQESDYYVVNNFTDFKELLAFGQDSSLKFRLKNDLDLATEPNFYIPYLAGEFDGNDHKISNLSFNFDFASQVGLFGYIAPGGIINQVGVENVNITGSIDIGGLVGENHGTVSNSYSTGSVTGNTSVGGLVGENYGTVSNSYSTGSITGTSYVGGLVGFQYLGTVSNSYATGNVTGRSYVSGLVADNSGTISNSYSTGSVTGTFHVGGLVAYNDFIVSNSFWDIKTSGQPTSDGGTGKNTTQMQDISTFSGATWNITAVALNETNSAYMWNIVNNVTYPFLSWQS